MSGIFTKRGSLDTDVCTRRTLCEDKGREREDASTKQGAPKIASELLEARGEASKIDCPSRPSEETNLPTMWSCTTTSRTVRKYISNVGTPLVVHWLRICLPVQERLVWSLGKIPHAEEQLSPCATVPEPRLQSPGAALVSPEPRACAPVKRSPSSLQPEEAGTQQWRPSAAKKK